MKIPELLAPAANIVCAQTAFEHGADAIYLGYETLNLRARSTNFNYHELIDILRFAKDKSKKVYCALNSMPNDSGIESIKEALATFKDQSITPDAFIVSDPGVILLCKTYFPDIPLHLSTQTGTFNTLSAQFWSQQGISRVILPRELSIDQIAVLTQNAGVETEVFVHGAMCMSISGRCLMGAYMAGRHPNLGDCPQPCRFKYKISPIPDNETLGLEDKSLQKDKTREWFTVEENTEAYLFNSKDLNALPVLDKLVRANIASIKIEGRHRTQHYIASVVKIYRVALDALKANENDYHVLQEWLEELDRLDHRPYTTGFYDGEYMLQDVKDSRPKRDLRIVGVVRGFLEGKGVVVDVKNPFLPGDILNVLPIKKKTLSFDATIKSCYDLNENPLPRALTNRLVVIESDPVLENGDILRKKAT